MSIPKEKIKELIDENFCTVDAEDKEGIEFYSTNEIIESFTSIDNVNKNDLIDIMYELGFKIDLIVDQYKWVMKKR
jgi:hypothetical protein